MWSQSRCFTLLRYPVSVGWLLYIFNCTLPLIVCHVMSCSSTAPSKWLSLLGSHFHIPWVKSYCPIPLFQSDHKSEVLNEWTVLGLVTQTNLINCCYMACSIRAAGEADTCNVHYEFITTWLWWDYQSSPLPDLSMWNKLGQISLTSSQRLILVVFRVTGLKRFSWNCWRASSLLFGRRFSC